MPNRAGTFARCLAAIVCVAFAPVLGVHLGRAATDASPATPLVIAHYMHCYVLGGIPADDDRILNPAQLQNLAVWPPLAEESSWFAPALSSLAASGTRAIALDFDMAEQTGIDAFGLLLGPRMLPNSAYSAALGLLPATAQTRRTKIIPEIWGDLWADDYARFGSNVKAWFDRYPEAFQYRDGKPIVIFAVSYSAAHNSVDQQRIAAANVAAFLRSWGGAEHVYTVVYLPYELSVAVASPLVQSADAVDVWTPQDDWSALHGGVSEQVASVLGKPFAFPVAPAFYQRRAGLEPWEYGNSLGAARYLDAWAQAAAKHPAFIDIQTWNDFSENSAVTDSNTSGKAFLHLTRYGIELARGEKPSAMDKERLLLFRPKQLVRAALDDETALTNNASWRHNTPTVDYIDCVTMLRKPGHLNLQLGEDTWGQDVPAGVHEWLIYAPSSVPPFRPGQVVASNGSFPSGNASRTVTTVGQLYAGTPQASLSRNGKTVMQVRSRVPLLTAGPFQDFTMIADEAEAAWPQ